MKDRAAVECSCCLLAMAMALAVSSFCRAQETVAAATPTAPAKLAPPAVDPAFPDAPVSLPGDHFAVLRTQSPFRRSLNLAETYTLKAVSRIGENSVATIYNRETKKTFTVATNGEVSPGADILKLVEVAGAGDLTTTAIKIDVAGETAELKYALEQVTPPTKNTIGSGMAAKGPPGGAPGKPDGERRGPTPEEIERYKKLPPEKQEVLRGYIRQVMEKYPDLPREERGAMIRGALVRLSDGHDIKLDPPKDGGSGASPSGGGGGDRR